MNETGLTVRNESHALDFRAATDAAGMCREIVSKTAQNIGGRKYVRVEGWQAIAVAHGCIASAGQVERIDGGIRATGEVRRGSDGFLLSSAEGFVGEDESTWANRPEYAKRAMAQTRAISRACRSAFAHVVVLMDAGLETTPAEEVPHGGFDDAPRAPVKMPTAAAKPKPSKPSRKHEIPEDAETVTGTLEAVSVKPTKKGTNRYGCKIGETWYGTFDDKIGEKAEALKGAEVWATVSKRGQYWDLHGIEPATAPEDTQPEPEPQPEIDGDAQGNIPF